MLLTPPVTRGFFANPFKGRGGKAVRGALATALFVFMLVIHEGGLGFWMALILYGILGLLSPRQER
jgi:hypothetical protein